MRLRHNLPRTRQFISQLKALSLPPSKNLNLFYRFTEKHEKLLFKLDDTQRNVVLDAKRQKN